MRRIVLCIVTLALLLSMTLMFAFGPAAENAYAMEPLVVDQADILSAEEEAQLEQILQEIRSRQRIELVVLTVNSLEGKSVAIYADDFYDMNGYGYGPEHDGAILIVAMDDRKYSITTCGYGITAFTDYGLNELEDKIGPYLSAGTYFEAFKQYAETGDSYVTQARNGRPYDDYTKPQGGDEPGTADKGEFPWATRAGISGLAGVIVSLIATQSMKGNLKTVRGQTSANMYVRPEDRLLSNSVRERDIYLYTDTHRVLIRHDTDGDEGVGRGSKVHISSSGVTHGGGHHNKF